MNKKIIHLHELKDFQIDMQVMVLSGACKNQLEIGELLNLSPSGIYTYTNRYAELYETKSGVGQIACALAFEHIKIEAMRNAILQFHPPAKYF